jgi:hypothetical protein
MTTFHPSVRVLAASIRANVPVLLWGAPGVGKTAQISKFGDAWGYYVETVIGSNREAVDFLGFPADRDGVTSYLSLGWVERLRNAEKGLLFLDELSTAQPSVQKAMLRVLQERVVGETVLPDTVSIVAAANPPEIAVDGWDLASPVSNRLIHIEWYFDSETWLEGLVSNFQLSESPQLSEILSRKDRSVEARAAVAAFLKTRPDLINPGVPTDPTIAGRAWPSPRSWTNFASVIGHLREDDIDALMIAATGAVGNGAGREFISWFETSDLYNVYDVLKDPSIVNWSERPDRIYALVTTLAAVGRIGNNPRTWSRAVAALTACARYQRPDLAYPGMRSLMQYVPEGVKVPQETISAFRELFTATGRWKADSAA